LPVPQETTGPCGSTLRGSLGATGMWSMPDDRDKRPTVGRSVARWLTALLLPAVLALVVPRIYYWHRAHELETTDKRALLSACRALIAQYQLDHGSEMSNGGQFPVPPDMVAAINALRPKYVTVRRDHVLICISVIPRLYVLAFADGADQFGRGILMDGLRFSPDPAGDEDAARRLAVQDRSLHRSEEGAKSPTSEVTHDTR